MDKKSTFIAVISLAALLTGSAMAEPKPWTHLNYQNSPDDFQFAIVPDRTGGDYRGAFTNALAKVNMMHPEFTITAVDPSRPVNADLRTARVVCDVASKECVDAAVELRATLAMVAGKNEAEADGFVFAVGEVPPGETVSETECRAKMSGGRLCFWGGASGRGTLEAVRGFLEKKLGVKRTGPGVEDVEFVQQIEMPVLEGEAWRFPQ